MSSPSMTKPDDNNSEDFGYESSLKLEKNGVDVVKYDPESPAVELEDFPTKRKRRCWLPKLPVEGEQLLVAMTITGVLIGIALGFGIRATQPSETTVTMVKFPGELLMRMLKMLIIPIIVTSIVTGLSNLDMKKSGRMGGHAMAYYLSTTTLAVVLGIILVSAIRPGNSGQVYDHNTEEAPQEVSTLDTYLDLLRNVFPENIITACFEVTQTKRTVIPYEKVPNSTVNESDSIYATMPVLKYNKKLVMVHNTNVLGVIAFFVAFGVTLSSLGEQGRPVAILFSTFNTIFMKMIKAVIWYSPFGICSLIAGNILKLGDLTEIGKSLGMYMVTVVVGLLIHGLIVLPLLYFIVTRKNPYKFACGLTQALLTALGTASSAGTLPITMRCLENNLGVDKRVSQFVLPLGATMNMDGTALLEGVAAITIAQMSNMTLTFGQIITISVTATMASIGAAAIPSAGLVTLLLVLTAVGIPTDAVGLLWSIDWLLDRLRTSLNVFGDCIGAGIVQHLNEEHLRKMDEKTKLNSRAESAGNTLVVEEKRPFLEVVVKS